MLWVLVSKAEIRECREEEKNAFSVRWLSFFLGEKGKMFSCFGYHKWSESLHPLGINYAYSCNQLCRCTQLAVHAPWRKESKLKKQDAVLPCCSQINRHVEKSKSRKDIMIQMITLRLCKILK